MSNTLIKLATKWGKLPHIRAALREHLKDALKSLGNLQDEKKEMTDLLLILEAYRDASGGDTCRDERIQKFAKYADSPPLAE